MEGVKITLNKISLKWRRDSLEPDAKHGRGQGGCGRGGAAAIRARAAVAPAAMEAVQLGATGT
jgi:hypothetical protein